MSAFVLSGIAVAMKRLNAAIEKVEVYCDGDGDANVNPLLGEAFSDLLNVRGELTAVMQLLELQHKLEKADTERPSSLRLVK